MLTKAVVSFADLVARGLIASGRAVDASGRRVQRLVHERSDDRALEAIRATPYATVRPRELTPTETKVAEVARRRALERQAVESR